jgi:protein-tyrosine phosphatase
MTTNTPGAQIPILTAPNLRDLGGWPVAGGGTVRDGLVYRSAELSRLTPDDGQALATLGVHRVYDLRTADERSAQPDALPPGVTSVVADVLADSKDAAPAALANLLTDPSSAGDLLGGGKAEELMQGAYRQIVGLPSALAAYRTMFTELARDANRPALFHCTTGKDRTGWGAAALLLLLGVPEDAVREDYLLTNAQLLPALEPVFQAFEQVGGDRALLEPILGVREAYLDAALDEMRARFGTIEGYFADGLGIGAAAQAALREALVDPEAAPATA